MVRDFAKHPFPQGDPSESTHCHFCDINDFCKWFEPLYTHRLLQSGWHCGERLHSDSFSRDDSGIIAARKRLFRT
jgi:hypothetical protein